MLPAPTARSVDGLHLEVDESTADRRLLRLTAERDLTDLGSGHFADPTGGVLWPRHEMDHGIEWCGFAFTQFALPVTAGSDLDFDFAPTPGLHSPSVVLPLLGRLDDRVTLLAPLAAPHEQIIAVSERGLRWGWHGDLATVPAGFATELGWYEADDVASALTSWRHDLGLDDGMPSHDTTSRRSTLVSHLSYWTDNGAAYWYRTEHGRTIVESVVDVVAALDGDDIPVRSVEIDSWWYQHEIPRPIAEIGYPDDVPPTGLMRWEPRADAFAPDAGLPDLRSVHERLGGRPLILHTRHLSPSTPYVAEWVDSEWWVEEFAAQPADPTAFRRWFDDAAAAGATVIELDWMMVTWFCVRALRRQPGRALDWQRALDRLAGERDIDLVWCMATPADLIAAAELDRVVAVRTCDDYRFAEDPAFLWRWFLMVNRLAGALGLTVFKDCFFSSADVGDGSDAIDGDPHAEVEALLSALSGGPVGIGDRIGRTDREVVMRTCDDDGRLRRVDRPIAAVDDCLFGQGADDDRLTWAITTATRPDGVWTYVVAIHASTDRTPIGDGFGFDGDRFVVDWRSGDERIADRIDADLGPRDWALWLVAPPGVTSLPPDADPSRYVVVESAHPEDLARRADAAAPHEAVQN
ncbi:MAG: hypothetical protein AAF945_13640 [Actinomycetota bacterium]